MKKFLLLLIFTPLLSISQSQTFSGTIKDIVTLEPIGMASIYVEGSNIGTVSNEDGKFRLIFPGSNPKIIVSHISYKSYGYIPEQPGELEIYLEPNEIVMEEARVTNQPIDKILGDILSNSKKHLEKSLLINTYYREFVKLNGEYTKFSDGLLDYHVKKKNGSSDLYVQESRALRIAGKPAENKEMTDQLYLFDVRDAVADAYNFKEIRYLLSSQNYDYELKSKTAKDGRVLDVVYITPKSDVNFVAYSGSVTFDPVKNLIVEIDIRYSPEHKKYAKEINALIVRFTVNDIVQKSSFTIDGDKYIMAYSQNKMNLHVKVKNKLDDTFEFMSDLVSTNYKEGEFEFDRKLRHKERSLFAAGNKFKSEFWKTNNIMLLTAEEEQVIKAFQ